jgi:hypothetical protein
MDESQSVLLSLPGLFSIAKKNNLYTYHRVGQCQMEVYCIQHLLPLAPQRNSSEPAASAADAQ